MFQIYDLNGKFILRERHSPHLRRGSGVRLLHVGDRVVPTSIVRLAADRHAGTVPPSWRLQGCFRSVSWQDRRVRGHVISSAVFLSYWGSRRHRWRATARQQEAFRSGRQPLKCAGNAPSGWGRECAPRAEVLARWLCWYRLAAGDHFACQDLAAGVFQSRRRLMPTQIARGAPGATMVVFSQSAEL